MLPIIQPETTCDGCGACCMTMCSPPMYVGYVVNPDWHSDDDEDSIHVRTMPAELVTELRDYAVTKKFNRMRGISLETPCLWLDPTTKKCRHYEWRPSICREFEMGSDACHEWRKEFFQQTPDSFPEK